MIISRIMMIMALGLAPMMAASCAQDLGGVFGAGASEEVAVIETETGNHTFEIEFVDTDEERRLGLMHRTELAANAGMLFDFGEPQPVSMWMKNTLIPLDMAFIDEQGVIKRIAANTTPLSLESILSGSPVVAVLEVNGGIFEKLGIEEGDTVRHPMFEPQDH